MRMDLGSARRRLHVLQSLLNNSSRSRSDKSWFFRRCSWCQPWGRTGVRKSLPHPFRRHSSGFPARNLAEAGRKSARSQYPRSFRETLERVSMMAGWYQFQLPTQTTSPDVYGRFHAVLNYRHPLSTADPAAPQQNLTCSSPPGIPVRGSVIEGQFVGMEDGIGWRIFTVGLVI